MNDFKPFSIFMFGFVLLFFNAQLFADTYNFAIIGDAGYLNSDTQNIHDSLLRNQVHNLVMPGDNIYQDPIFYPTYESVWATWFPEGFKFDVVAIGNHNRGYPEEIAYFNMPSESYAVTYNKLVKFVVLNSDNESTADTQAKFLDTVLSTSTTPYVFVVYHHPSYTLSIFHNASEKKYFQEAVRPILFKNRNKVTALIVGHDHVSIVAHYNDLPVILSGSTHEHRPQIPLNYWEGNVKILTNWYNDSDAVWAHLSVDSHLNYAQIDFVRGYDDKIMCTLNLVTGSRANLLENCVQY